MAHFLYKIDKCSFVNENYRNLKIVLKTLTNSFNHIKTIFGDKVKIQ